jgi:predicted nucleic acid-binding protein
VLLYAISTDPAEAGKAEHAERVLAERDLGLSVQVLQEFYVQATRAGRRDRLSHTDAAGLVATFQRFRCVDITRQLMLAAIDTHDRFQISYWDAAIVEAARALGADVVLSEDLADGQDYAGVRVENPFT